MVRNESTKALWLDRARSLQGWNVATSHARAGSKLVMEARTELASFPVLPLFAMLELM